MPCSEQTPQAAQLVIEEQKVAILDDRLRMTARYLCGVLGWLEGQDMEIGLGVNKIRKGYDNPLDLILREIEVATPGVNPGDIQDWWEAHQEQDEARQDDQRSAFVFGED